MNIEHRTLNVQHRIMNSVNLKNTEQAYSAEGAAKARSEATLRNLIWRPSTGSGPELAEGSSPQAAVFRSRLQRGSLVLK
jgi:hypothetical protein